MIFFIVWKLTLVLCSVLPLLAISGVVISKSLSSDASEGQGKTKIINIYICNNNFICLYELINEIKGVADSINSGDKKICTKCNEAKDKEEFYDESLASGVGRICKSCKGNRKQYNKLDKKQTVKKTSIVDTNVQCPQCSSGMVLRNGRYGKFYGCSNYPRCRGTRQAH